MAQQSLLATNAAGTPNHSSSNGTSGRNNNNTNHSNNNGPGSDGTPKPAIERGAGWSYNETRILLSLWGQDMVQRQLTNSKRTRHVWEKIAERIKEHGFERTSDQVRTRVFNMIAEYRRILKNPTAERKKKCIFFDALHKIYQAKDANGVRAALSNYGEELNLEPLEFAPLDDQSGYESKDPNDPEMMDMNSGSDNEERSEIFSYAMSPSQLNGFSSFAGMNGNDLEMMSGKQMEGGNDDGDLGSVGASHGYKRMRSENGNPMATNHFAIGDMGMYDSSTSTVLIDRMFAHLSRETEVMREWVVLERERLQHELSRRREEAEREERREHSFLQTLVKMQQQMFDFLSRQRLIQPEAAAAASAQLAATVASVKSSSADQSGLESPQEERPASNSE